MVVICRGSILKCHSSPATLCADIVHTKCNAAPLLAAVSAAGSSPASASPGCSTYYSATARKKVKRSSETSLSNAKTKISLSEKIGSIVKLLDKLASSIATDTAKISTSAATATVAAADAAAAGNHAARGGNSDQGGQSTDEGAE
jgi:hypothetical protein